LRHEFGRYATLHLPTTVLRDAPGAGVDARVVCETVAIALHGSGRRQGPAVVRGRHDRRYIGGHPNTKTPQRVVSMSVLLLQLDL
jgi:hypothetical protein